MILIVSFALVSDYSRHEASIVRASRHGESKEREIWSTRGSTPADC